MFFLGFLPLMFFFSFNASAFEQALLQNFRAYLCTFITTCVVTSLPFFLFCLC